MTLPSRRSPPTGLPSVLAGGEIQHVVHQLERHAEVPGEFARASLRLLRRRRRITRAQLGAGGEQAGGLAVHQFHAIGFGDVDAADALELEQLAFHHHLGEADQQVENLEIALAQGDLKGLHVEPVAGQHAGVIAPLALAEGRPRRVSATSITSSCTSVAAWIISTTAPSWMALSSIAARPAAQTAAAGGPQPLAAARCRYWPMVVTARPRPPIRG